MRHSIPFHRAKNITFFFNFLGRFNTQDSESEVRIHFNDRFDCQFLHFTSLSDELGKFPKKCHKCEVALMCHNDLDRFENWITKLICYGTSTPRVLG